MNWRDPSGYDTRDAIGTIGSLGGWWEELLGPGAAWAAPFLATQRDALTALGGRGEEDDDLVAIRRQSRRAVEALRDDWREGPGRQLLSTSLRLLHDAGEAKRAMRLTPARAEGLLHRINVSDGGVPKRSVESATITVGGVEGDRQATRKHHGRPWQALCLWSADVIEAMRSEGHPIEPGSAGENLTISGLDWGTVTAGVRLRIGEAHVEVSAFADPCSANAQWLADGDLGHLNHRAGPRRGRVYASVLRGGAVRAGDPVVLEPA